MPKIKVMAEELANKIAAGEVVERPASVVKELVENAIDAQSTIIDVSVSEGGLDKIRVVDNGVGMEREDALLSFARHASSKLTSAQDLFRISTLGFRGEALPSIASVSHLTMQTWNGQEDVGTKVCVEGGEIKEIVDAPLRQGTLIEVSNLFYNTPARYKYLRSVHTELGHIADYMNRLALAFPTISFSLKHNDKQLLKTTGNSQLLSVIAEVYGRQVAQKMIPVSAEHIDFTVEGYLAQPEINRSSRKYMTTLINGRYVRHHALNQAIQRAYHTLLPIHRFPLTVLSLRLDPSLVDVNVHPAKLEVRLSKEQELVEWLETVLKDTLTSKQQIPQALSLTNRQRKEKKPIQEQINFKLPVESITSPVVKESSPPLEKKWSAAREERLTAEKEISIANEQQIKQQNRDSSSVQSTVSQTSTDIHNPDEKARETDILADNRIPMLSAIGQLHGTYILAQNEQGLFMIDQHAAQERIWFEYFYEKLNEPVRESQTLIVPIVIECTAAETLLLKEYKPLLADLGLFLEEFGYHTYMIRSHPVWFPKGEEESLIREIIDYFVQHKKKPEWITIREKVAIMMACKQAIKANKYLTKQEMESLLEQLRNSSNPFTCPHGRPITVLLTKYDIEKMFKRVM